MSIITISRGSYTKGKEIAEKVAQRLDYECVARKIILEASDHFNIPEAKLTRALHDSPSILSRLTFGKEKYAAYIRYALLQYLHKDNVVYHGLAGHFFLQNIPHVLKIRIIADMNMRIKEEMERENISEDEARRILVKDDDERRKWSLHLYNIDTRDSSLYDMVLHIGRITVDEAVDIIVVTSKNPGFITTPKGQEIFNNLLLSAQVQSLLIKEFPTVTVSCEKGNAIISYAGSLEKKKATLEQIEKMLINVTELEHIEVNISPVLVPD